MATRAGARRGSSPSNRQGLQFQAMSYLPPGLLSATPGAIDVRQLPDREDALLVVLPHQLGRHPVQQTQVVLLLRLLETGVPEGAARTVFVQDNRRRFAGRVINPDPQGLDDPSDLFVFAGQLYLAGVATQPDQRSRGRLPALHFAEDETLVGEAEGVRPRCFVGADHLHQLVAVPSQPRWHVHLREKVTACPEDTRSQFRVSK